MFDQMFRYPGVVRRHRDGPLAHERATYLASLATRLNNDALRITESLVMDYFHATNLEF